MLSGISEDLPIYLKSKFSVTNPPSPPRKPHVNCKPALTQGVSSDSPPFFHLSHASVISDSLRIREISKQDQHSGRFLSNLKQNQVSLKPKFSYTDSQFCEFDYHQMKPSKFIDMAADKSPKMKEMTKFREEFQSHLQRGFGVPRGQCTLEAMQPKVPRYLLGQIEAIQNKLSLTQKKYLKAKQVAEKTQFNTTALVFPSLVPRIQKKKQNSRKTSTPQSLSELDEFEKRPKEQFSPVELRKMYEIEGRR